jgi:putative ABC transport system permease protein
MKEVQPSPPAAGRQPPPAPPRVAEWILRRVLPDGTIGESIIGDLREEFSAEFRRHGPLRARLGHLRKTLSVFGRFALPPLPRSPSGRRVNDQKANTMSAIWYDLRQALRLLVRKPGLTIVAIVSLGLGIGANTAIFSLVNTILLKPLPYPDSHELVEAFRVDERVTGLTPDVGRVSGIWAVPYEVHEDWLGAGPVFASGGGYSGTMVQLEEGDERERVLAARMTSGAFQALGTQPSLGRTFLPEDDAVGASPAVVLSHGLWENRFGQDPDILGRQIQLDGTLYTVTGVMPQDFGFPDNRYQAWVTFSDDQKTSPTRNSGYMKVVARLAPGMTLEQARLEMAQFSRRNGELHPEEVEHGVGLFPLKTLIIGSSGGGLLVLLGAVTLVLLIACTNIAGLFLVRATERRREIGVRRALGAGGRRIVFQHLSEALILSVLGAGLGWWLAVVGLEPLLSLMPSELPRIGEMRIDENLLFTAMGFALLTGLLTGILPALKAAGTPITQVLQEGGRGFSGGRKSNRMQSALVISQVALAFVLLTGAGLFIRSMTSLLSVDPGFNTENLALADVSWPSEAEDMDEALVFYRELERRIRALPGVVDVAAADQMPFTSGFSTPPVTVETTEGPQEIAAIFPSVTTTFFTTMEIPILEGRGLGPEDVGSSEPVVVISQTLADLMAPDGSPLGMRVRLDAGSDPIWRTVVGVVSDVKFRLNFRSLPMVYASMEQGPSYMDNWVVRTASNPLSLAPALQRLGEEMDPEGTMRVRELDAMIHGSYAVVSARFSVILLGSLAGLAALLALFGVYGVLAYLVQLRSREIGIQIALGAEKGEVLKQVIRRGLTMGGIGLLSGLVLALALGRLAESQLFGVGAWDLKSFVGAGVLLLGATLTASYLPARRAAGTDPVQVLKGE